MGFSEKLTNQLKKLKGKAKEAEGRATGDDMRRAQGQAGQSEADLKQAGENVKDAFRKKE
jgi:uncharacterized protein YjbJ (UPF0337 family)